MNPLDHVRARADDASIVVALVVTAIVPEAVIFYPTIGLVAEVALHLLPLALLVLAFRAISGRHTLTIRQLFVYYALCHLAWGYLRLDLLY